MKNKYQKAVVAEDKFAKKEGEEGLNFFLQLVPLVTPDTTDNTKEKVSVIKEQKKILGQSKNTAANRKRSEVCSLIYW